MTRFRRQLEAYRMSRRIVRACNRMNAGKGPALQWCLECRYVLKWQARVIHRGIYRRKPVPVPTFSPGFYPQLSGRAERAPFDIRD